MGSDRGAARRGGRITYAEAAAILDCGVSNIPKMIRAGYLTVGDVRRRPALDRAEVERLAADRARRAAEREAPPSPGPDPRPDAEHEWLTCEETARRIGVTPQAVAKRLRKGTMPGV